MNIPVLNTVGPDYLDLAASHIQTVYEYIVYGKPTMMELPAGTVFGTWCISVPGKIRYILARDMELAPGVLPGDVARAWVRYNYDLPIKRRKDQKRRYILPLMAKIGKYPEAVYLDIRHAYLTILETVGYNVDYRLGKYLAAKPCILPDIVKKTKWIYAIIVAMSAGTRSHMTIKTKEKGIITRGSFNVFSNRCLYAVTSEVMAAIAGQILRRFQDKVFYINTDGYLVDPVIAEGLNCVVRDWGFEIREKARGECEVFGPGAWRCGSEQTARRDMRTHDICSDMPNEQEARWLQCSLMNWRKLREAAINEDTGTATTQS